MLITNDYAAVGAIEALTIAGLSVPNDISVIGYDDLGQAATPLTTIRCNLIEVGRTAGQQLLSGLRQIAGRSRRQYPLNW